MKSSEFILRLLSELKQDNIGEYLVSHPDELDYYSNLLYVKIRIEENKSL